MAININKLGVRIDGCANLVEDAVDKRDSARQQSEGIVRGIDLPNTSTRPSHLNLNRLGDRVDGWADLISGIGDKESEVKNRVVQIITPKLPAYVTLKQASISDPYGKKREYIVLEMQNGATITIYVKASGGDLYVTWSLYVKPMLNTRGCLINSLLTILTGGIYLILYIALHAIVQVNPQIALFKVLSEFDADDITTITLLVHQSLLASLDAVGIQAQVLRVKEQFAAGRRERLI